MLKSLFGSTFARQSGQGQVSVRLVIDDVSILWRKSSRRRRSLALKVDKSGQLVAMTPMRTSERELRKFVRLRTSWIETQLAQFKETEASRTRSFGRQYWFLGTQYQVLAQTGLKNQITLKDGDLEITSRQDLDKEQRDRRIRKWLREQANQILPTRLASISRKTGLQGSDYQIKSYTARWGSCGHDGLIQLNWKLIMLPEEVIDYVIVHELCHLVHFNHSAKFWALVESHCAQYQLHRRSLKQNGQIFL